MLSKKSFVLDITNVLTFSISFFSSCNQFMIQFKNMSILQLMKKKIKDIRNKYFVSFIFTCGKIFDIEEKCIHSLNNLLRVYLEFPFIKAAFYEGIN